MGSDERGPWLRTKLAAKYCGLSASTLEKLRCVGGGPAFCKVGAKVVVYAVNELDRWLATDQRTSTSDRGQQ
jgi:hypothetical protein